MRTIFRILDRESDEVAKEIPTTKGGRNLEMLRNGLFRKVDPERFYIEETSEDDDG